MNVHLEKKENKRKKLTECFITATNNQTMTL